MVDLEGACAKQACPFPSIPQHSYLALTLTLRQAKHPDHHEEQCTPAKISSYRPHCGAIMRRSGMKTHGDVKLDPEIAQKL
jgi:hypothetical protein